MQGEHKPSVVLLLRDLGLGGAERVVVRLANFLASQGVVTHLVLLVGGGPLESEVGSDVNVHNLAAGRIRSALLPLCRLLAKLQPNAVMSTLPQVNAIAVVACLLQVRRPRIVLREANDPRHESPYSVRVAKLARQLVRAAYQRADLVIAVSSGVKAGLESVYALDPARVVAIPNASLDDSVALKAAVPLEDEWYDGLAKRIVCVARLSQQKDHATLLRAFSRLQPNEGVGMALIGSGPLEAETRALISELGLDGTVRIVANEANPFRWLRTADLLVLSSRWEGSPNVIVEALALGVPVVATDCPSGPRELLADGQYGELVPVGDAVALANAIAASLARTHSAETLVRRSQQYHIETVGPLWLTALLPN